MPTRDAGSALSILDVLNSAVGIAAPIYGGVLLHRLGVESQPSVSAVHYVVLFALVRATSFAKGGGGAGDDDEGEKKEK